MNDYIEARISLTPCSETITDIAAALLADAGYESFVPDGEGLTAYIRKECFDRAATDAALAALPFDPEITVSINEIEGRDWNSEWERNYFRPIVAGGGKCVIHSSFHADYPHAEYDITIDPKMAFGTGHHATTSLIIDRLLQMDLKGRRVMDMGTGTAILAILAAMRGAEVSAVEIDEFAHANALDNVKLNHHPEISIALGDASALRDVKDIDLFLANINRNVITADMERYAATLAPGADVIFSGFYVEDIPVVAEAAARCGLTVVDHTERNRWASLHLRAAAKKPNPLLRTLMIAIIATLGCLGVSAGNGSGFSPFTWGADVGAAVDASGHDMSAFTIDAYFGCSNPYIDIAGIGAGIDMMVSNSCRTFPIYGIVRTSFRRRPSLCFMDFRCGGAINNMSNGSTLNAFYISPGVGFNLALSPKFKSYFIVSYTYNDIGKYAPEPGVTAITHGLHLINARIGITF